MHNACSISAQSHTHTHTITHTHGTHTITHRHTHTLHPIYVYTGKGTVTNPGSSSMKAASTTSNTMKQGTRDLVEMAKERSGWMHISL